MPLEYIQWKEAVAGAVSGALTVLALHPLDVIKTRLQVQEAKPDRGFASRYKGAVHAFRVIQRREGIRGLYSGVHVPESGIAACPVVLHTTSCFALVSTSHCMYVYLLQDTNLVRSSRHNSTAHTQIIAHKSTH